MPEAPTPHYKIGKPYKVDGKVYEPQFTTEFTEIGLSSWYGSQFHKRKTANGEIFDKNAMTAAHKTLPLPSMVRVTNLENGKTALLRVNDRGPFKKGRVIDVSEAASKQLGFYIKGLAKVKVELDKEATLAALKGFLSENERKKLESKFKEYDKKKSQKIPSEPILKSQDNGVVKHNDTKPKKEKDNDKKIPKSLQKKTSNENIESLKNSASLTPNNSQTAKIFIYLGSFESKLEADKAYNQLKNISTGKVSAIQENGVEKYQVILGGFSSAAEAGKSFDKINNLGYKNAKIVKK
jgi:rare lipoprotein A